VGIKKAGSASALPGKWLLAWQADVWFEDLLGVSFQRGDESILRKQAPAHNVSD